MAGSSNFLQWNPAQNNMENDAAYLADSMRLNGATAQIYPSNLHNKAMYQQTTFTAAFSQMLASRGFTVSDSSLSALMAVFDELVDKTGATMTGNLILNGDPTTNLQAATKQYVDNNAGTASLRRLTAYSVGDIAYSAHLKSYLRLECTTAGTTAASEPTWPTTAEQSVSDGTVVWKTKDVRIANNGIFVGTIMPFLATSAPAGWLALDTGALVSRATYPDLWTWVQENAPLISETAWQTQAAAQTSVGAYSTGDGSTTFRLPKIIDYVRGGLTADVGAWQGDAIRNITGQMGLWGSYFAGGNGALSKVNNGDRCSITTSTSGPENYLTVSFDASTVVPTAGENRPKTIKMLYCVKAFDSSINQGTIDITALANEVAAKQTATKFIKISDSKTYNTAGGTFTSGAWRTRDINTIDTDETGLASVASNQITLPAGTYYVDITASAQACNAHKARLYNITTSATLLNGTSEYASSTYAGKTNSIVNGKIILTASSVLEIQHYCGTTGTYGTAANISGVNEIYTTAIFRKVG